MMNMVNNVFDFIRNVFAWADRNTRKRTASDTLTYETEFVTNNKRFRSNDTLYGREIFIDVEQDENDENDDIEILSEFNSRLLRSSSQMNNNRGNKRRSFPASKATCYRTPQSKTSHHCMSNNSSMGCFNGKDQPTENAAADCRHFTLSRTHRLQEKMQYGELLQNFLPRRVHVLQNETKNHVSPIEVIELDKSDESQNSQKSIPVQKRQSYNPWRKERERTLSMGRLRTPSQSTTSRIQVEKEEPEIKVLEPTEKRNDSGEIFIYEIFNFTDLK